MKKEWYDKRLTHELILGKNREPGPFDFVLVLDHLKAGFNVGKTIRAANALGCREVHLINIPRFDPSPAKGTLRQTRLVIWENLSDCLESLRQAGYRFFALDPQGAQSVGEVSFPVKTALILGNEELGFAWSKEALEAVQKVKILQFGAVESLNVSQAASIVMYEYLRQRQFLPIRTYVAKPFHQDQA